MPTILEKTERRIGEKLLLKSERCAGPKCAMVRKGYPPGMHGKKKSRKRAESEFGKLLRAKQKIRFIYGVDDAAVKRYVKEAAAKRGVFAVNFLKLLESRIDNCVWRAGFAGSRREAKQLVSHGHIMVNDKTTGIPSRRLKIGDKIKIKELYLKTPAAIALDANLKKYEPPAWLKLDKNKKTAEIAGEPDIETLLSDFDAAKIKEFYLR